MRSQRWLLQALVLAAVVGVTRPAHALAHLDFEAGGGLDFRHEQAPAGSLRIGIDALNLLQISVRGQYVFGADPSANFVSGETFAPQRAQNGFRAWNAFAEIRLRTPTPVIQFDLGLGGGLGHVVGLYHAETSQSGITQSDTAPFGQLALGVRVNIPVTDIFIRLEGAGQAYTQVTGPYTVNQGSDGKGTLPVFQAMLSVGYVGPGFDIF